ncbi:Putative acetyltransferase (GNAT) family [Streptococcus gallolyticus]|uniref:Putative acetyltransferase (GNAT) family n=1 Tax=Streptococcus gallolyticus TaxID=315405 RepID=A0A060RK91_9STRE|nr:GNAT family N-acetyltransferase [Streptococcus gallolyticus]CDO17792.1 Putative acetyltransferase (GNAT) family [Streptococcus gallolyticus]
MQISIFEPKFNQAVIDLILTIQQEEFSLPISLTEQPDLLDIENSYQKQGGQFWVAINERKEVLGCIGLVALEQDNVALKKMFVSKNYRKAGLGKELLKAFVAYCQKEQKKAIFLEQQQILRLLSTFTENLVFKQLNHQIYLLIFHV